MVCFYGFQCNSSAVCESLKGFFCDLQTAWRLVLSMKPWSYIWLEFGLFSTIIYIYIYISITGMPRRLFVAIFNMLCCCCPKTVLHRDSKSLCNVNVHRFKSHEFYLAASGPFKYQADVLMQERVPLCIDEAKRISVELIHIIFIFNRRSSDWLRS